MPRPRLPEGERKENITLKLRKWIIDEVQKIENYNPKLEKYFIQFIKDNKKE